MKKPLIKIILITLLFLVLAPISLADVFIPKVTNVYFEYDSKDYDKSVNYTVDCYGTPMLYDDTAESEKNTVKKIFSYSATCPEYGCKIYDPYYIRGSLEYCNLEGKSEDGEFKIDNFGKLPYAKCARANEQIKTYDGDNYYKTTPEYDECANKDGSLDECDQYLEIIPDSELKKDDKDNVLEESCEMYFKIPAGSFAANTPENTIEDKEDVSVDDTAEAEVASDSSNNTVAETEDTSDDVVKAEEKSFYSDKLLYGLLGIIILLLLAVLIRRK